MPVYRTSSSNEYLNNEYTVLKKECKGNKVLLEVPVTHLQTNGGIYQGLKYIGGVQLASLYHGCHLINGYSGYDFSPLIDLDTQINSLLKTNNREELIKLYKSTGADFVKINGKMLKAQNIKSEIIRLK